VYFKGLNDIVRVVLLAATSGSARTSGQSDGVHDEGAGAGFSLPAHEVHLPIAEPQPQPEQQLQVGDGWQYRGSLLRLLYGARMNEFPLFVLCDLRSGERVSPKRLFWGSCEHRMNNGTCTLQFFPLID
jgi:hypothetical protein